MVQGCITFSNTRFFETNTVFQLFQSSIGIFLVASVLTLLKQHFSSPIDCVYDGLLEQQKSFVDSYCWKNYEPISPQVSTISMSSAPGKPRFQGTNTAFSTDMLHKKFQPLNYRWFPLILLFQSLLAYMPIWLWNTLRDRRLFETVSCLKDPFRQQNRRKLLIINLANDLLTDVAQRRYAKPFFLCEIFNVVTFGLNVLITNLSCQNHFMMFGFREIGMKFGKSINPNISHQDTSEVFPAYAKCSVQFLRKGNEIKKEDAICMIPFNSLCESIFMFFWIWYCFLMLTAMTGITYRLFVIFSSWKRRKLLMECVDKTFENKISTICEKLGFYSWFTLYRISRNIDPLTFQDIISSLMSRFDSLPQPAIKESKCRSFQNKFTTVERSELATTV